MYYKRKKIPTVTALLMELRSRRPIYTGEQFPTRAVMVLAWTVHRAENEIKAGNCYYAVWANRSGSIHIKGADNGNT